MEDKLFTKQIVDDHISLENYGQHSILILTIDNLNRNDRFAPCLLDKIDQVLMADLIFLAPQHLYDICNLVQTKSGFQFQEGDLEKMNLINITYKNFELASATGKQLCDFVAVLDKLSWSQMAYNVDLAFFQPQRSSKKSQPQRPDLHYSLWRMPTFLTSDQLSFQFETSVLGEIFSAKVHFQFTSKVTNQLNIFFICQHLTKLLDLINIHLLPTLIPKEDEQVSLSSSQNSSSLTQIESALAAIATPCVETLHFNDFTVDYEVKLKGLYWLIFNSGSFLSFKIYAGNNQSLSFNHSSDQMGEVREESTQQQLDRDESALDFTVLPEFIKKLVVSKEIERLEVSGQIDEQFSMQSNFDSLFLSLILQIGSVAKQGANKSKVNMGKQEASENKMGQHTTLSSIQLTYENALQLQYQIKTQQLTAKIQAQHKFAEQLIESLSIFISSINSCQIIDSVVVDLYDQQCKDFLQTNVSMQIQSQKSSSSGHSSFSGEDTTLKNSQPIHFFQILRELFGATVDVATSQVMIGGCEKWRMYYEKQQQVCNYLLTCHIFNMNIYQEGNFNILAEWDTTATNDRILAQSTQMKDSGCIFLTYYMEELVHYLSFLRLLSTQWINIHFSCLASEQRCKSMEQTLNDIRKETNQKLLWLPQQQLIRSLNQTASQIEKLPFLINLKLFLSPLLEYISPALQNQMIKLRARKVLLFKIASMKKCCFRILKVRHEVLLEALSFII